MIIICKVLRVVTGAKWGLYQALSNPVRLYIGQQKANPSKPFLVPWWCPSFGERWHLFFLVSFGPDVPSQDRRWRCTNQEALCFTQFGPWSFQSGKQLRSMGTWHILFDCIYIVGIKAKIALDKVKHSRKTIQGYCDAMPELGLKLAPLKQKNIEGERKILGHDHIFTMRGSLVSWGEVPTDVGLLLSHQNWKMVVLSALMIIF